MLVGIIAKLYFSLHKCQRALTLQLGSTQTAIVTFSPKTCSSFLFSFFAVSFCTFLIHRILTLYRLTTINSFNPPCSPVALLVHPHICLCCFLCCCPGLSETDVDFPVLPLQASVCSLAHPPLMLAVCATPFHQYHILTFLMTAEKQTSALCFNKPQTKVLQERVSPCSFPGFGAILTPSKDQGPAASCTRL